jgi:hypothetical protein
MACPPAHIQIRRDISGNWWTVNPILLPGEFGYATDVGELRIGNGGRWNASSVIGAKGDTGVAGISFSPTTLQVILPILYPTGTSSYPTIAGGYVKGDVINPSTGVRTTIGNSNLSTGQAVYFLNGNVSYNGTPKLTQYTIYYLNNLDQTNGYAQLRSTASAGNVVTW